jgi:hypothetical protein
MKEGVSFCLRECGKYLSAWIQSIAEVNLSATSITGIFTEETNEYSMLKLTKVIIYQLNRHGSLCGRQALRVIGVSFNSHMIIKISESSTCTVYMRVA